MDFESIDKLTNDEVDNFYDDLISCTWCSNCGDGSYRCHYFFRLGTCSRDASKSCHAQSYCDPAYYGGVACTCGDGAYGCEGREGYNLCGSAAFSRFCS